MHPKIFILTPPKLPARKKTKSVAFFPPKYTKFESALTRRVKKKKFFFCAEIEVSSFFAFKSWLDLFAKPERSQIFNAFRLCFFARSDVESGELQYHGDVFHGAQIARGPAVPDATLLAKQKALF
jgi:hypothetical protein